MSAQELRELVSEAERLAGVDVCAVIGHDYWSVGGRACPYCEAGYSQTVFRCARCGEYDYGERGGPAWEECAESCPGFRP